MSLVFVASGKNLLAAFNFFLEMPIRMEQEMPMSEIELTRLQPGMVVGRDVKDRNGRLLVAARTSLTERHVRIMKIWGVNAVFVEDGREDKVQDEVDLPPEIMTAAEESLRRRFSFNDLKDEAVSELFRIGLRKRALQLANGLGGGDGKRKNQALPSRSRAAQRSFEFIRELLEGDVRLTTLPAVYLKINETIKKPSSSTQEIAEMIGKDTSLTARLLKLVNSSFYGYPTAIDSLPKAVSIVGTSQLSMLAFGIDLVDEFKDIPKGYIDMDSFWRHSLACGIVARLLATVRNIQTTERLFMAGMLHDIGRLVLYNYLPDEAVSILEEAAQRGELLYRAEEARLGKDHAEIGGQLLQIWRLPQSLENAVRFHHRPVESPNGLEPALVHVADVVVKAMGVGSSGGDFVPPLDPKAWQQAGLPVKCLEPIAGQAERQLEEIFSLFFP